MHVVIRNSCVVAGFFFVSVCLASAERNFNYETMSNQKCSDPIIIQLVDEAKKEINDRMYLTVATVDENSSPWNAPVYSAFDQKYNFYWMSAITSQHSINIRLNSKAFAVIYDSTVPEGTGFGVYMRGNSRELSASDFDEINHG